MARMLRSQQLDLLEALVRTAGRCAARLGRRPELPEHLEVGRRGEEAAFFYLRRRGFVVVARGWRSKALRGDLDLIAWDGLTLCFIEVKTRTSRDSATAESAVDQEKSRMLRRMARNYIQSMPGAPEQTRFDILSIYFGAGKPPEFEFFPNAFGWY